MSGYVVVVPTPYFAVTDKDGNFDIKDVPAGHYTLRHGARRESRRPRQSTVAAGAVTVDLTVQEVTRLQPGAAERHSERARTKLVDLDWLESNFPCMQACPVHTQAGRYVHLIAEGRYEEAYRYARLPNPFASICGRVCGHPCETAAGAENSMRRFPSAP